MICRTLVRNGGVTAAERDKLVAAGWPDASHVRFVQRFLLSMRLYGPVCGLCLGAGHYEMLEAMLHSPGVEPDER